jgi:hypothetical protein
MHARFLMVLVGVLGCQGSIGDSDPLNPINPLPMSVTPGGDPPAEACAQLAEGAPIPTRRLTAAQLEATVQDVLGFETEYDTSDETLTGYRANTTTSVEQEAANEFMRTSEDISAAVAPRLVELCEGPCADWILENIAPRLFRRPLSAEVATRYRGLYELGFAEGGDVEGVSWLLQGLLQSPRFLYLLEEAGDGGFLDSFAMAARLSYALWGTAPDVALLESAAAGNLATPEGIRTESERLIADDRFEEGAREFVLQWLRLESLLDESKRADFFELPGDLRAALLEEPVQLFVHQVRAGSTIAGLIEEPISVENELLDGMYGAESIRTEEGIRHLDPERRAGLLTLPGVQAALSHAEESAPTVRGFIILDNFLCDKPPPPPVGVTPTLPPNDGTLSTRERLSIHFEDDTCGGCHRQMDGIGFAFENYDWLGRWRDEDNGEAIDASADFMLSGHRILADGPVGMSDAIGGRWDVDLCIARQWVIYASAIANTADAQCLMEDMALGSREEGIREMLLTFVSSDWFRRPFEGASP